NAFTSLVQRDSKQRFTGNGVDHCEIVDRHRPVVQLDSGPEFLAETTRNRSVDRRQVGLGYFKRGMHQPMSKLAIVGQQDQALGVGVEPSHMKKLLVAPNSVFDQI